MRFPRLRRPLPIGARWTLFYSAVMLATIVLLGTALYFTIQRKVYREARLLLEYYVSEAVEEVGEADRSAEPASDVVEHVVAELAVVDSALHPGAARFDTEGRVVTAKGALAATAFPNPQLDTRSRSKRLGFELDLGKPHPFLASFVPIEGGSLLVAIDTSRFARTASGMLEIFAIAFPIAVLIAIAGGIWLARRTLRPIAEIAATAKRITGEQLDVKVPTTGSNDELDQLAATLNDMIRRIRESVEKLRNVSLGAAHQLKSPLARLRSQIEVALETEPMEPSSRKRLERILEEVLEMSEGLTAMLRLVRSEAGLAPHQARPVDLSSLLDSIATLFEAMASERSIQLRFAVPAQTVVKGDPAWLSQLFGNLVDNALRYSEPGGCVEIAGECEADRVAIRVSDTGVGIAPEDIPRVFDRFHRGLRERNVPGWGLGLAIAYEIARSHGGSIAIESRVGVGSAFTVYLPRIGGEAETSIVRARRERAAHSPHWTALAPEPPSP